MNEVVGLLIIIGFGSLGVWVRMGGHHRVAAQLRTRWNSKREALRSSRGAGRDKV